MYDPSSDKAWLTCSGPLLSWKVMNAPWCAKTDSWTGETDLVVDPAKAGNMLRFMNDKEGMDAFYGRADFPNVTVVEAEDQATLLPHMFVFATRDIEAGEELIFDYGDVRLPSFPSVLTMDVGIDFKIDSIGRLTDNAVLKF